MNRSLSLELVVFFAAACSLASLSCRGALPVAAVDSFAAGSPLVPPRVLAIAAGESHTCVVLGDHAVKCWGANHRGQLGLGDTNARGGEPGQMGDALPALDLGPGRTALATMAGFGHTCALLDDHSVKCWGANDKGQLGLGDRNDRGFEPGQMGAALPAVDLGPGHTAVAIAAGSFHTCALLDNHSVKCWGENADGALGLPDREKRGVEPGQMGDALPAVDLGPGRTALSIAAGDHHTCVVLDDHSVKCWGETPHGELGFGDKGSRTGVTPRALGDLLPVVDLGPGRTALAIMAGSRHTCALLDDHRLKCWGSNADGQLGLGDTKSRGEKPGEMGTALPVVDLGPGRTALSIATGGAHTCVVLDDHTMKCWGSNFSGQLGRANDEPATIGGAPHEMGAALPVIDLGQGRTVRAIATGGAHTCAILDNNEVKCWGMNLGGELGLGDKVNRGEKKGQMGEALPEVRLR